MRVYNKHPGTVEGIGAGQYGTISERAYKRAPWAFSIEPEREDDQKGKSSEGSTGAQNSAGSGGGASGGDPAGQ